MNRTGTLTGLLGGSFNPAHGGHRRISLQMAKALGLAEVWWLVSPGNPLKPDAGMAPLSKRFASACAMGRRAPIRVTAIERELGTRYTVDTLRALLQRYPRRRFVWIMGADNLAQFHKWRDWQAIARLLPVAVAARPGYDAQAMASPAMARLRRHRRRPEDLSKRVRWSGPALIILRFDPDKRSASAIRAGEPDWHKAWSARQLRDAVTHRLIPGDQC